MVHTPCLGKDKSVIYTGMFLRPQCAESLKQLISHKLVQERALFAVAKTQVHLNGLCEIVVRKLDTTVSTSSIMELLKQCYDIVQSRSPDCEGKGDKLNRTIDLTCDDNNSPRPLTERKITFQRHPFISSSSSGESDLNFPSVQSFPSSSQVKSIFEQDANSHYVSLSPQKTETSRKVSFKRKITDSIEPVKLSKQSPNEFSLKPVEGRPNIVVQLSNEGKTLITEKIDDPKKSVSPQVFEDPLPSAPTWTSTEPSKFPLSNVSRLLGAKLLPSSSTSDSEHAEQAVDQLSISKISEEAPKISSASASKIMSGSEISNSILDESLEILEMCKSQGSANSDVSASEVLTKGKINGNGGKNRLEVNLLGALNKKEEKEQTYNATIDQQRGTNSKKSQVQISNLKNRSDVNDDDIIIEKELKSDRTSLQHALIIDDSDDDIAVCEIVPSKISAGTNFVASTSSGFAPDFIPLTPFHRRINPKVSNSLSQRHVIMKKKCTNKEKGKLKRNMKLHLQSNCTKEEASGAVDKKPKRVTNKEKNGLRVNPIGTNTCESKKHDFDGNIMNPNSGEPKLGLRPVVIDASNVAVGHGRGSFSVAGLKICIKYFLDRGHKVHAIAPKFRRFRVSPEERKTLDELENDGVLSFTPSRTMPDGRKVASYDDRFIVQTAAELGGVVVSTDNFRDLLSENETWRETIEQRLLMFTWVGDMLLFPNDPLGRNGPHLQEFLRFPDSPPKDK